MANRKFSVYKRFRYRLGKLGENPKQANHLLEAALLGVPLPTGIANLVALDGEGGWAFRDAKLAALVVEERARQDAPGPERVNVPAELATAHERLRSALKYRQVTRYNAVSRYLLRVFLELGGRAGAETASFDRACVDGGLRELANQLRRAGFISFDETEGSARWNWRPTRLLLKHLPAAPEPALTGPTADAVTRTVDDLRRRNDDLERRIRELEAEQARQRDQLQEHESAIRRIGALVDAADQSPAAVAATVAAKAARWAPAEAEMARAAAEKQRAKDRRAKDAAAVETRKVWDQTTTKPDIDDGRSTFDDVLENGL